MACGRCRLGGGLQFGVRIKRRLGLPLLRLDPRQQLAALDDVALVHQELFQAALDFRADGDLIRSDDPGEHEDLPAAPDGVIDARRRPEGEHDEQDQQPALLGSEKIRAPLPRALQSCKHGARLPPAAATPASQLCSAITRITRRKELLRARGLLW